MRERVEELFADWVELPREEQERHIAELALTEPEAAEEVATLLRAYADRPAILDRNERKSDHQPAMPRRIGPFRLIEEIGKGGMGVVYLGLRDDIGSRAAIKLLPPAWRKNDAWQRFEREQKMLAALNHRHIAQFRECGEQDGTPWFAMEYVQGKHLTEYAESRGLGLKERLRLFLAACQAVSYAHQQLVLHLDIKPSNILVTPEGEVKLVDFGIAKHLSETTRAAEQTQLADRMISMNYAAPEQFLAAPVNVATDVYGLGVVLYELLAGRVPVDLQTASYTERVHLMQQLPNRPSASSTAVSATRREWKDLDPICLKALHRDPQRRYPSVVELTDDIERFLEKRTVQARPYSATYRLSQFVRRNRAPVIATAAALLALMTSSAFFTARVIRARDEAVLARARTQRVQQVLVNLFEGGDEVNGPTASMRVVDVLHRGVLEVNAMQGSPEIQAELELTLGRVFHKLGMLNRSETLLRSSLARRRRVLRADHPDLVSSLFALSELRATQGVTQEAIDLASEALRTVEGMQPRPELLYAQALTMLANASARAEGQADRASQLVHQAIDILRNKEPTIELSEALGVVAVVEYERGRQEAAERAVTQGLEVDLTVYGTENHPKVSISLFNLGHIELDRGEYAKAGSLYRRALRGTENWYGPDHLQTAEQLTALGRALHYQGRFDEAARLHDRAVAIFKSAPMTRKAAVAWNNKGILALDRSELADAEQCFLRAAEIFRAEGEGTAGFVTQQSNLGAVLTARGEFNRAVKILSSARGQIRALVGDKHRLTAITQTRLAAALLGKGQLQEAEREAAAAFAVLDSSKPEMKPTAERNTALRLLIAICESMGEREKARDLRTKLLTGERTPVISSHQTRVE